MSKYVFESITYRWHLVLSLLDYGSNQCHSQMFFCCFVLKTCNMLTSSLCNYLTRNELFEMCEIMCPQQVLAITMPTFTIQSNQ